MNRRTDWADHLLEELGRWWSAVQAVLVLISDLYEGGIAEEMLRRAADIVSSEARPALPRRSARGNVLVTRKRSARRR